ncbi:hypothetical protein CEXT_152321 [Caerostris extrusa]|uniref:Uncharacterized protein n=1 Tax=Caerostris extrusa TaxID=172846 RepID=A0AAV4UW59_CAEEX|nr:hypothetical protein CEXT_152321 [Caerostris extrusa]
MRAEEVKAQCVGGIDFSALLPRMNISQRKLSLQKFDTNGPFCGEKEENLLVLVVAAILASDVGGGHVVERLSLQDAPMIIASSTWKKTNQVQLVPENASK